MHPSFLQQEKGNRAMFWLPLSITTASMPLKTLSRVRNLQILQNIVTNYFPLVAYDSRQLYMTSILFWGEIWNPVPSLATSQNSKATLKAWATVSVTAWAWGNTTVTHSDRQNIQWTDPTYKVSMSVITGLQTEGSFRSKYIHIIPLLTQDSFC